jgi:spore maturation protein SpmA
MFCGGRPYFIHEPLVDKSYIFNENHWLVINSWKDGTMLNHVWVAFFAVSFFVASLQLILHGDAGAMKAMLDITFTTSKTAFEIAIGLVGTLTLWQGILRVGKDAGLVDALARGLAPLFQRIMPEVPANHPALGTMTLSMATNVLGLDNAATPIGIQAMKEMQELNTTPDTATNAQILFLVINSSSVTLLPITILMYRAQLGAAEPAIVFLPILFATTASTLAGFFTVAWIQKLKIFDKTMLAYGVGISGTIGLLAWHFSRITAELQSEHSAALAATLLMTVLTGFLLAGWWRKVPVYESFIEGAKEGFGVAIALIPYLVAMLVAIALCRASGAMGVAIEGIQALFQMMQLDTDFVPALPTALMKPFSGSGARGMMLELMQSHGVDSFPAKIAAVIQGSTETTFYILAVYYGAIGVKKIRHTLGCALVADLVGIVTAILVGYWFFH